MFPLLLLPADTYTCRSHGTCRPDYNCNCFNNFNSSLTPIVFPTQCDICMPG